MEKLSSMTDTTPDNIASESQEEAKLSTEDTYMQRFATVETKGSTLRNMVNMIDVQPDQDARLFMVIKCMKEQQQLNDEMYDLLVEMNNLFAPK